MSKSKGCSPICPKGHTKSITGEDKFGHCRECARLKTRQYYNQHIRGRSTRKYAIKALYGLSLGDEAALLLKQNNCCAICGISKEQYIKNFSVDHDHKTGKVRGLLCSTCNLLIGHAKDSTRILGAAMAYLTQGELQEKLLAYI